MFVAMLTGCGDSNEKLSKEFVEHLKGYYDVVDDNTKRDITFKSNKLEFFGCRLEVEEKEYGKYHIVAVMGNYMNPRDQVWKLSLEELRNELHFFAEAFIDFAKSKNMDNEYYLYVRTFDSLQTGFVYDYEKDLLYLPEKYDLYCEMFEKFGTAYEYEVCKTEDGVQWLVDNDFGEVKHHEYESKREHPKPVVYIDEDGNFGSRELTLFYTP